MRNAPVLRVPLQSGCAASRAGFSEAYLRELLAGWQQVQLVPVPVPVPVPHRKTGEPFKHVWRGIARR